jgi:hypothetical protein
MISTGAFSYSIHWDPEVSKRCSWWVHCIIRFQIYYTESYVFVVRYAEPPGLNVLLRFWLHIYIINYSWKIWVFKFFHLKSTGAFSYSIHWDPEVSKRCSWWVHCLNRFQIYYTESYVFVVRYAEPPGLNVHLRFWLHIYIINYSWKI